MIQMCSYIADDNNITFNNNKLFYIKFRDTLNHYEKNMLLHSEIKWMNGFKHLGYL